MSVAPVPAPGGRFTSQRGRVARRTSLAALTWRAGVDVLCLGGAECGMLGGEAIVFRDRSLRHEFARCKQAGQLLSKMRFVAAQWAAPLEADAWLTYAGHANAMARRPHAMLRDALGVAAMFRVQANSVFVALDPHVVRGWDLYSFIRVGGVRFTSSSETAKSEVNRLEHDLRAVISPTTQRL